MATQEVMDVVSWPLLETKNIIKMLFDNVSVRVAIIAFLVLYLVDWVLLSYKGSPVSCKTEDGVCRVIFLNIYSMFYLIFMFILFLFWMKITASGVKAHGFTPSAFANAFSVFFFFNVLNLIFVELTTLFRNDIGGVAEAIDSKASGEIKFTEAIRFYIGFVINAFAGKFSKGSEAGGDDFSGETESNGMFSPTTSLFYGLIFGSLAGALV